MSRFTYPGVYREEIPNQRRVPQSISAANFAIASFFERGPVNEPILVTSLTEAQRVFGNYTSKSFGMTSLAAYFANGGSRAYITRVVGDDAAPAEGWFTETEDDDSSFATNQSGGSGSAITFSDSLDQDRIIPGTVTIRTNDENVYTSQDTGTDFDTSTTSYSFNISAGNVIKPNSVTVTLDGNSITDDGDGSLTHASVSSASIDYETGDVDITMSSVPSGTGDIEVDFTDILSEEVDDETVAIGTPAKTSYSGVLDSAPIVANSDLTSLTAGSIINFSWTDDTGSSRTAEVDSNGDITGDATGELDLETGVFELVLSGNSVEDDGEIVVNYWAEDFLEATDDGSGNITGPLESGGSTTIDYEAGEISNFTSVSVTDSSADIEYDYKIHDLAADNPGDWGNNLRVSLSGDENFVNSDGDYTQFVATVEEAQTVSGSTTYTVRETFDGITITDTTASDHISQVFNDPFNGSDLVDVNTPLSNVVPQELLGQQSLSLGIANGSGGSPLTVNTNLYKYGGREIVPGSVEVTYQSVGATKTITDDSAGGLEGDVDLASPFEVNYETGLLKFTTSDAVDSQSSAFDISVTFNVTSSDDTDDGDFQDGTDGAAVARDDVTDFATLSPDDEGIYAFNAVEDPLILAVPDFAGDQLAEQALISYADDRDDSIALVAPPEGASVSQAINYRKNVLASQSDRAAMYHPHITVNDPVTNTGIAFPPHGHVAGIWAKTDANRNVGKSPAGTQDGALSFLIDFEQDFSKADVGRLTQVNINALWQPSGQPRSVWGVRTLQTGGEFRYINRRRSVDVISVTVARSLWWTVFENNNPSLWLTVREQVRGILRRFYRQGVLAGETEEEAFFVKVDEENNPRSVIEAGQLIVNYGLKTQTPAEFIRLQHEQILQ